ncbi:unnamed protein product [Heligmosomoides polygyrus]|uniref:ABC transporter domain-containing protein n=1 Tax=Heligmosomoides polygyrus TaxID=6339 RepID=A0A3P8CLG6_HELPZ|nr:unnamed protein product [Heligmosomoides polygyrus]
MESHAISMGEALKGLRVQRGVRGWVPTATRKEGPGEGSGRVVRRANKILLDGDNLRKLCPDELRGMCSLVSQEPVLFDGTISDNIRYGRLDATQQEINDAARKVGAWQFISSLPEGMQTRVGDRGLQLSGGQKQRVAIARAVIRKPTVMLFDEATSALDNIHEEEVQHALDLASEGLTTITIAHRLSTVKNCDRIIVLDEGRIVEEGAPDELLAKEGGRFQRVGVEVLSLHPFSLTYVFVLALQ